MTWKPRRHCGERSLALAACRKRIATDEIAEIVKIDLLSRIFGTHIACEGRVVVGSSGRSEDSMEPMDRFEDDQIVLPQRMTERAQRAPSTHAKHSARAEQNASRAHLGSRQALYHRVEWHGQNSPAVARALSRLEREHVALLLALCELESDASPSQGPTDTPAVRNALRALLQDDLRRAQHALQRAAEGLYGLCESCQHPLPARQLAVNPAATHCAGCGGSAPKVYH